MSQADEKDTDLAPEGFTVNAELSASDALEAAHNYADTVERSLICLATRAGEGALDREGDLDAVLWSLSYTAAMAKALIEEATKAAMKDKGGAK